ncbi:MAG: pentapeptide repeat-containing protein [Okeania sp. SIO2G4]|uniref:pentapeptide repeat-containing protein n=1 Tax=unclassified Okeania TaxID=2634635 RepID=UPI0013B6DA63|nr:MULTISPECIES: pentapeptide repeat-containing protein [unclassified Okeania]NEP06249.1 pentapeptide repeat-containing protein [Okeania sp. SIO4D6]NEP38240.1 pentapeptide repeat-containing protein [Okeania sp. SIO2H7]NEP75482.1 pentapeptide repeat-containing protein [Okeania sp. SIO2G5]NEP96358.1 pentapeptide repeat-containing protein [Okeania sp. SIO2F5]NEQ94329.1 pentapeptide repeat-containing protein [Okeania sp. SIO2G4]
MMRAREILQEDEKGRRDFQGVSLRGLSFEGEDLSGADFSGADIRGTNFRGANLSGAKFQGARAGLQKRWVVVLLVGVFVLVGLSAFLNLFTSALILLIFDSSRIENQVFGWLYLILTILPWIMFIYKGVENSAEAFAVAVTGAFGVAVAFVIAGYLGITKAVAVAGAVVVALAVAGAGVFAVALAGAFAVAGVIAIVFAIAIAFVIAIAIAFAAKVVATFAYSFDVAFVATLFQTLLSSYFADRGMKEDDKYTFLHNIAVAFAALCGTSFRDANLTDADFTNATLKSTNFRGANITRTCWKNTIKLDRIRPGTTYLKEPKVRELVRTGKGENQNFNRFNDLQGVNLQGANLTNASFIEANLNLANLQDTNLSRAKLVGTFLDQADLTGATLTGAFLEDWGITTRTKLDGIKCDYVYMRLPPDQRPEFLKLTPEESLNDNPRRQPADWEKIFEEGEFVNFITPMVETLDLYHNQAVDPRIVAYSFRKLQEDHPEAELRMRSMEIRGKNDEGLLIKAETTPQADHSVLHSEYFQTYNETTALPSEQVRLLLAEKDKQIRQLTAWVDTTVNRSGGVNIENYSNEGSTNMSEGSGNQIDIRENYGIGKDGEIRGAVGNTGEIYGLAGSQGEIKDSKIARNIYEAQQKTLAETAA